MEGCRQGRAGTRQRLGEAGQGYSKASNGQKRAMHTQACTADVSQLASPLPHQPRAASSPAACEEAACESCAACAAHRRQVPQPHHQAAPAVIREAVSRGVARSLFMRGPAHGQILQQDALLRPPGWHGLPGGMAPTRWRDQPGGTWQLVCGSTAPPQLVHTPPRPGTSRTPGLTR